MMSFGAFLAFLLSSSDRHFVHAFQSTPARLPWGVPPTALTATRAPSPSSQSSRRNSKTATYYSTSGDPPFDNKKASDSFGDRMRNLVLNEERKKVHNPNRPSFVHEAVTLQEYKEIVGDEKKRLVVVRFYAKWCRACKAAEPYFYRLAKSHPDVKFVEVPVLEENANLHQGLGVPALPFAHIYSPTVGLVEELRMSKKEFKTFHSILETYIAGECSDLEADPETGMYSSPYHRFEDVAETTEG